MTATNESCMVCHASDRIAPIAPAHALAYPTGTQKNVTVAIGNVDVDANRRLAVTFSVTDPAALTTVGTSDLRVYLAGYDPSTVTTGGSGFFRYYAQDSGGILVNNGSGSYTYTTVTSLNAAPPTTTTQRLFLGVAKSGENTGNAFYDFDVTAAATGTTGLASVANPRDIVPTAVCNKCHVDRIGDFGHGGSRNITEACVICHSPLYPTKPFAADRADFPSFIHQIHSGTANPNLIKTKATFPADMKNCTVCHTGGANSDNYLKKPSRWACTSCHTNVNFDTGAGHSGRDGVGGPQGDDSLCAACHGPTGPYHADKYHSMTPAPTDPTYDVSMQPEFVVSMVISPPSNGTYYRAGEAPTVTITLKDALTGNPVADSLYTTSKDGAGNAGGGLSSAGLYVYGPRSAPMPVLTTGAAVTPVAKQSNSLLLPSTDPQVLTTTGSFSYKLTPIPAGMTPGTYMVRFYAQDYGYVSDSNWRVSSNAFQTIQIGTATPSPKISGDCTRCHGTYNAPFHNARHAVVFDTDQCESCHDLSGNHANLLANRIHSVHSGSQTGDLMDIDWSTTTSYQLASGQLAGPITYPVGTRNGDIMNCAVCHSSGNVQYTQNVHEQSCRGCHNDTPAARAHMLQNGGK